MNILALDLGTRTGWALCEAGRVESGVQDFTPKRGDSPGMRYIAFRRWLADIGLRVESSGRSLSSAPNAVVTSWYAPRVDLIVYEMPHLRGGAAATVLANLQGRVEEFCADQRIEHRAVHTATLKKFATGKGNAKKPEMDAALIARGWWGHVLTRAPRDDNEVDAVCLLHYALDELVPGVTASAARSAPSHPTTQPVAPPSAPR